VGKVDSAGFQKQRREPWAEGGIDGVGSRQLSAVRGTAPTGGPLALGEMRVVWFPHHEDRIGGEARHFPQGSRTGAA
jgi:hypothetical protein